ncbi:hypothetical protein HG530_008654 [Fusarium avenaceum]|nr:hypothetical protein HG530_008654 [Fusarium avenaceum]
MHAADSKVRLAHLVCEPVDLAAGVAEDDSLRDVLLLDGDKVLLETFEGQLVTLDKNANRIGHELGGHVEHIVRESGADNHDLGGRGEVSVNIVDLLSESLVEELIGLIEDQHLDVSGTQVSSSDHVCYSAWRAGDDVLAVVELADILSNVGSTDTSMTLNIHNQSLCLSDCGIDDLQHTDRESSSLSGTGLGLGNGVATLADLDDGSRLNSGR